MNYAKWVLILVGLAGIGVLVGYEMDGVSFTRIPRQYIVGVDVTEGREQLMRTDSFFIASRLLPALEERDRLMAFALHGKSESEPSEILSITMPAEKGAFEEAWQRITDRNDSLFAKSWNRVIRSYPKSSLSRSTDIFGFLRFVSVHRADGYQNVIILLSDMQDVGDGLNFEMRVPDSTTTKLCVSKGLVADLSGMELSILGCTSTHGISNEHYRRLAHWWNKSYLPLTKAMVRAYASDYAFSKEE